MCSSDLLTAGQHKKSHTSTAECDPSLWAHVWSPERLKKLADCVEVTGTVTECRRESDGDLHILLLPDKPYAGMLNAVNEKEKAGCLVIEIVCVGNGKEKKEKESCDGYKNHIQVPEVNDRIKVSGSLVTDLHHGWNEIHPVSRITRAGKKK